MSGDSAALPRNSLRVSALKTEQRALIKELLGIEWSEQCDDLTNDNDIVALALGFLPENSPPNSWR